MRLPENVLHYILNDYEPIQETMKEKKQANLNFSSEYKRNGEIFRGHSNYKKQGKWHDWVMIRWELDGTAEQKPELVQECNIRHMETEENKKSKFLYSPGQILHFVSPKMVLLMPL